MRRRKVLVQFGELQELVLRGNDHKGGWDGCSLSYLMTKLHEEVDELVVALGRGSRERVSREAVDVANVAMMIADNWGQL